MCFKYIFNSRASLPGQLNIGFSLTKGINDGCLSCRFNVVGGFRQAIGIELFNVHFDGFGFITARSSKKFRTS